MEQVWKGRVGRVAAENSRHMEREAKAVVEKGLVATEAAARAAVTVASPEAAAVADGAQVKGVARGMAKVAIVGGGGVGRRW